MIAPPLPSTTYAFLIVTLTKVNDLTFSAIVKNLATNPNESIREAAVASIGYVANQSNKNEMTKVLNAAAGDVSAVVRAQANKQLAKITA